MASQLSSMLMAAIALLSAVLVALLLYYYRQRVAVLLKPLRLPFFAKFGGKGKQASESLELLHFEKESLFLTVKKMLLEHYPESEIIGAMRDMGIRQETCEKVLLLSKTSALNACKAEADSTTGQNAEEQMAKIEQMLSGSSQYFDISEKLSEIEGKTKAKKAIEEKQLSFEELSGLVEDLFSKDYAEIEVLAMFSELGIGDASARAIVSAAKQKIATVQKAESAKEKLAKEGPIVPLEQAIPEKFPGKISENPAAGALPKKEEFVPKFFSPKQPTIAQITPKGIMGETSALEAEKIEGRLNQMEDSLKKELSYLGILASKHDERFSEAVSSLGSELSRIRGELEKYKRGSDSEKLSAKISKIRSLEQRLMKLRDENASEKNSLNSMLEKMGPNDPKKPYKMGS